MTHEAPPPLPPRGFDVVDAHTHLAWEDCVPPAFIEASLDNVQTSLSARGIASSRSAIRERVASGLQDPWGDELVATLDAAGVARSAIMVPDFTFIAKSRLTIEELLLHHARVAERHAGRFVLFAGVDPRWGREGVDLFERAVTRWGFSGLKLYPPCGFRPSDASVYPLYEICRARQLPVLLHIGPTSPCLAFDTAHPALLDQACRDFPTVNFVLGHGGAHHVEQCVQMAAFRPNVYIDSSGMQIGSSVGQLTADLNRLLSKGIAHKLLYGTDWPIARTPMTDVVKTLFDDSSLEDATDLDLRLLASENFERLWRPALASNDGIDLSGAALSRHAGDGQRPPSALPGRAQ